MTIKEVEEKAESIWKSNNPSQISFLNDDKQNFVDGVVEGFKMGKEDHSLKLLSKFIVNDESEHETILSNLRSALFNTPDEYVDTVKNLQVWEKIEFTFTVKEFCQLIDLNLQNEF